MNHKTTPILLNIIQHSKKAFSIFTLTLLLFSSFLLISTQTSVSQPVEFDFMFGSSGDGAGQFNGPQGIAVDSMKNIYVADQENHRIQVFDSAGNFLFMFGWRVDDGTNTFQICTSADTPCQAGSAGGGAGQFNFPFGIAVDSMKNIYVGDFSNNRIQVFDSAGNFLFMFGSFGGGPGQFEGAAGIAVDSMKNIYVADTFNNRIQVFDSAGNFLFMFGSFGGGPGQFNLPFGIAVDSMKNIYVSDKSNNRIQVFSESQEFINLSPTNATNDILTDHTVTATVDTDGVPEPGVLVTFEVISGPNAGKVSIPNSGECSQNDDCTTEGNGQVSWTYTGSKFPGADTIVASFFKLSTETVMESNTVEKIWVIPPRNVPTLSEWGLIAMAGILGIVGFMVIRRRKVTA